MLRLQDVFTDNKTMVFTIIDQEDDNELNWLLKPTKHLLIPEEEGYYIVRGIEVSETGTKNCFIDMHVPERISETVIKEVKGKVLVESVYDTENTAIAATASEIYGDYGLYYADEDPEVGIKVLKEGLEKARNKNIVAEDLGYILRDEGRVEEAIEAFKISEDFGPSTEYVYLELSDLYADLGDDELKDLYYQRFKENGGIDPE